MTTYYYLRFSETIVYRKRSLQADVLVAVKSLKFMVNKVQHRVAPLTLIRNEEVPAAQKRIFLCLCDNRSAASILLSLFPPWRQITARMVSTKLVAALVAWHASHQNSRGNTAKPENAQPTVHVGGGGMSLTTAVIT